MTWGKFGTEYRGQVMMAGLSDAAFRTHTEAHLWLYEVESRDLRIPKHLARVFAGSPDYETAIKELVAVGWWADGDGFWTVLHHADVHRQALTAQVSHREKEKNRQRAKRRKTPPDVGTNVGANVGATQTVSQSTRSVGPVLSREHFATTEPSGLDNKIGESKSVTPVTPASRAPGGSGGAVQAPPGPVIISYAPDGATPPHSLREHDGPETVADDAQHDSIRQSPATDRDRYARGKLHRRAS